MNVLSSSLTIDLLVHGGFFILQWGILIPGGVLQNGTTPPLIYPCWMILSAITLYRIHELRTDYKTGSILVPAAAICMTLGFCLINEMTRDLWAFALPRLFPVWVRITWYQLTLLLIHPHVYIHVRDATARGIDGLHRRGYFGWKMPVLLYVAGIGMWLLRNQNLSPDGYDWLKHSLIDKNWVNYLREPLGTFMFHLFVQAGVKAFHWAPYVSLTVLAILSGLIATWFMSHICRELTGESFQGYTLLAVISCCGYSQVFIGNVEIYALLQLGLVLFLYASLRYLFDQWSAWSVGLMFGILFCVHLSAGWWLPAFLLLPWIKRKMGDASSSIGKDYLRLSGSFLLLSGSFGLFVLLYGYQGNFMRLWNHFWSDQVMNVGSDAAMFRPFADYCTLHFYGTMLNEYFYLMPAGLILIVTWMGTHERTFQWTPLMQWFLVLTGGYLIYSGVWRPDRAFPADWDIFSGLTIPLMLLLSMGFSRLSLDKKAIQYCCYQACMFSLFYLLLQVIRNHIKVSNWPLFI